MPLVIGTELRYTSVDLEYDDTQLANLAQIGREGGAQQVAEDADSQDAYLVHTHNRTDLLMESDEEAKDYAAWIVYQSKDPELRFATIEINPQRDDILWAQVLAREIGDRITIIRRPPGGGTITRDVFIRGISHDATVSPLSWRTTWTLQSATKYQFVILDHPSLGVLDANALAF